MDCPGCNNKNKNLPSGINTTGDNSEDNPENKNNQNLKNIINKEIKIKEIENIEADTKELNSVKKIPQINIRADFCKKPLKNCSENFKENDNKISSTHLVVKDNSKQQTKNISVNLNKKNRMIEKNMLKKLPENKKDYNKMALRFIIPFSIAAAVSTGIFAVHEYKITRPMTQDMLAEEALIGKEIKADDYIFNITKDNLTDFKITDRITNFRKTDKANVEFIVTDNGAKTDISGVINTEYSKKDKKWKGADGSFYIIKNIEPEEDLKTIAEEKLKNLKIHLVNLKSGYTCTNIENIEITDNKKDKTKKYIIFDTTLTDGVCARDVRLKGNFIYNSEEKTWKLENSYKEVKVLKDTYMLEETDENLMLGKIKAIFDGETTSIDYVYENEEDEDENEEDEDDGDHRVYKTKTYKLDSKSIRDSLKIENYDSENDKFTISFSAHGKNSDVEDAEIEGTAVYELKDGHMMLKENNYKIVSVN